MRPLLLRKASAAVLLAFVLAIAWLAVFGALESADAHGDREQEGEELQGEDRDDDRDDERGKAHAHGGGDDDDDRDHKAKGRDAERGGGAGTTKISICHIPPGNPANAHMIRVGMPARDAHLSHGDSLGACPERDRGGSAAGKDRDHPDKDRDRDRDRAGSADDDDDDKDRDHRQDRDRGGSAAGDDRDRDHAGAGVDKVTLCHVPPGNSSNAHTIRVGEPALRAHLSHGDSLGSCPLPAAQAAGRDRAEVQSRVTVVKQTTLTRSVESGGAAAATQDKPLADTVAARQAEQAGVDDVAAPQAQQPSQDLGGLPSGADAADDVAAAPSDEAAMDDDAFAEQGGAAAPTPSADDDVASPSGLPATGTGGVANASAPLPMEAVAGLMAALAAAAAGGTVWLRHRARQS